MRGWSHAPSLHSTGGASTVRVDEVAMACHRALLEANEFARIRTVPVLDGVLPSSEASSAVWRDRLFDAPSRSVDGLRRCRSFVRCFVSCTTAFFPPDSFVSDPDDLLSIFPCTCATVSIGFVRDFGSKQSRRSHMRRSTRSVPFA
eukprot:scaffold1668_cov288-Pavlova_lutheri.AAC.2